MTAAGDQNADLGTIMTAIAHSPIIVVAAGFASRRLRPALPDGFGDADIAILDWIAREVRRAGHSLVRM